MHLKSSDLWNPPLFHRYHCTWTQKSKVKHCFFPSSAHLLLLLHTQYLWNRAWIWIVCEHLRYSSNSEHKHWKNYSLRYRHLILASGKELGRRISEKKTRSSLLGKHQLKAICAHLWCPWLGPSPAVLSPPGCICPFSKSSFQNTHPTKARAQCKAELPKPPLPIAHQD